MIAFNKALPCHWCQVWLAVMAALLSALAGCAPANNTSARPSETVLSIGFGENPDAGIRQTVQNIALEGLLRIDRDGRPSPWLAQQWSVSQDGLTWRLRLRSGATFHNGQPATAFVVRDIVLKELPGYVGPVFNDVQHVQAVSPEDLEFSLKRRSTFLQEGFDVLIRQEGESVNGTGPFMMGRQGAREVEMRANPAYYDGRPSIDRILFRSYDSVRAAWADMLRGRVDMLYEVGVDALDSLSGSTNAKIFPFERSYAFLAVLNTRNPKLRDKAVRRALNAAIDRAALIADALRGKGTPADGPVWPYHWASSQDLPRFRFQPIRLKTPLSFTCLLMTDQAHERIGLVLQRQLRAIGVEMVLEQVPSDQFVARLEAGNFEAALGDYRLGPGLLRQYQSWYSGAPYNWGRFSSAAVDNALDRIERSLDDASYKAGVADFQRSIIDDPAAIFLAWGERLRAVSTRFNVHEEPGRDIMSASMLRLWRPAADGRMNSPN